MIKKTKKSDSINSPAHYKNGIECLKYILSHEMDFLEGNCIKYITRYKLKGTPVDDLKKARVYLNHLIKMAQKKIKKVKCVAR